MCLNFCTSFYRNEIFIKKSFQFIIQLVIISLIEKLEEEKRALVRANGYYFAYGATLINFMVKSLSFEKINKISMISWEFFLLKIVAQLNHSRSLLKIDNQSNTRF